MSVFRPRGRAADRKVSSLQMVREATLEGAGAARLPGLLVQSDIADGKLVPLGLDAGPPVEIRALYSSRRFPSEKVRAFIDMPDQAAPRALGLKAQQEARAVHRVVLLFPSRNRISTRRTFTIALSRRRYGAYSRLRLTTARLSLFTAPFFHASIQRLSRSRWNPAHVGRIRRDLSSFDALQVHRRH
ncbi:LysR substrate-binding domain-containing protein [Paraburkholderia caribensis]|uniref:LysR substrate-binding domain-containing protein n=1 Tax=Paraburkholderia caribensis TaxID=75105 RepID=UPI001F25FACA|nr:LysR substrate-binding domain-containing protein [Paraburkholderia caribensis]